MNDTLPTLDRRRARALFGDDTGAATAEYAITTMATVNLDKQIFYRHDALRREPQLALHQQVNPLRARQTRLSSSALAFRSQPCRRRYTPSDNAHRDPRESGRRGASRI